MQSCSIGFFVKLGPGIGELTHLEILQWLSEDGVGVIII